jgi:hypothetical protein
MTPKPEYLITTRPTEILPTALDRTMLFLMRHAWSWSVKLGDQEVGGGYASSRGKAQRRAQAFADRHEASQESAYVYVANRPRTRVSQAHIIARDQKFVGDPE